MRASSLAINNNIAIMNIIEIIKSENFEADTPQFARVLIITLN
ncbi:hypothetical protein PLAN_50133 [Planktothrix rubescens CCAP 1459/22]|uniref:Uncharacterized protein n=1 Tax=Planktothrix rubescens CCAP 1459/22 TaxID=329571 RepID=A0A6J7ZRF2_PLARU|nr:hypothetical protein PLAN_50133 [Planktothrix rubescens NIVA-CYA 18]